MSTAKPSPDATILEFHAGADTVAVFEAAMKAFGVLIPYRFVREMIETVDPETGETIETPSETPTPVAWRPGKGVTISEPYKRVITLAVVDADGVVTTPAVMATSWTWLIGVDDTWVTDMIEADEPLTTNTDDLTDLFIMNGEVIDVDGDAARSLSGVWLFDAAPTGARRLAL